MADAGGGEEVGQAEGGGGDGGQDPRVLGRAPQERGVGVLGLGGGGEG